MNSHRDVTVLINDGDKTWAMMTEEVKVCHNSLNNNDNNAKN